jgi:nucleoside triphosphate pyrophosphatase
VAVPVVEETTGGDPHELVIDNAARKAKSVAARAAPGTLVVAGDTEVVVDGEVLGQPGGESEARAHLQRLSGRDHEVVGGVALIGPLGEGGDSPLRTGADVSTVSFRELEPGLIDAYLASGEWRGRAGSYAIQGLGSAFVSSVRGDVSNIIGLPVALLLRLAPELMAGH